MKVICIEQDKEMRKVLSLTLGKTYEVIYDDGMYHIKDDGGRVRIYNKEIFKEERK